jgi:hypothetical protein
MSQYPNTLSSTNKTCYALTSKGSCADFDGADDSAPGINRCAKNNLFYDNGKNETVIVNNGTGNTISNNTTNSAANPGMTNGIGSFGLISDFQPTAITRGNERAGLRFAPLIDSPHWMSRRSDHSA